MVFSVYIFLNEKQNVFLSPLPQSTDTMKRTWEIQSIDTMKYSRDKAKESLTNFQLSKDASIQIKEIAESGATHVAIGTPYDPEYLPVLKFWVRQARANHLKVFFRGNFSGWEEWNGYRKITRDEHIRLTKQFIENNSDLFEDGDIFSSCPECENGEKLDRSNNLQIEGYKTFLIREYTETQTSFSKIHKNIPSNFSSMNGDIAFRIMDKETTKALGGIVVIDHYVKTPEQLEKDIRQLVKVSGGKVMIGEIGAPIPSIHGKMTQKEQAMWMDDAFHRIATIPGVIGVNYWVNIGGSTALRTDEGAPKPVLKVIERYYKR